MPVSMALFQSYTFHTWKANCSAEGDIMRSYLQFQKKQSILNLYPIHTTQPFVQQNPLLRLHCKLFAGNLNYRKKLSSIALNSIAANPLTFTLLSGKVNPLVQCISHTVRVCWLFMFWCWIFISLLFIRSNYKATVMKIMSTDTWSNMSALWLFGLFK